MSLLAAFSVATVAAVIYSQRVEFVKILDISFDWLLLLGTVVLVNLFAQAYCAQVVTRISGVAIPFSEAFGLKILQLFANYIIPFGGWGFRAFYLKKVHSLDYKYYAAGVVGKFLCEMVVYSILGATALVFSLGSNPKAGSSILILFAGVFFCAMLFFFIPGKLRHFKKIANIIEVWHLVSRNRRNVAWLIFVNILEYATFVLTFFVAAAAYNIDVPSAFPFVSTSLSNFSLYIRLAPGALGTYEAFIYLASNLYNISLADSLIVSTILRSMLVFNFLLFSPPFIIIFAKKAKLKVSKIFYGSPE